MRLVTIDFDEDKIRNVYNKIKSGDIEEGEEIVLVGLLYRMYTTVTLEYSNKYGYMEIKFYTEKDGRRHGQKDRKLDDIDYQQFLNYVRGSTYRKYGIYGARESVLEKLQHLEGYDP